MNIPFGEDYLISSDEHCWTVKKKRTRKGRVDWRSVTYHSTFAQAIQNLGQRWVRESEANTLAEALVAVENITTQLSQAIPTTLRIKILNEEWFQIDNREALNDDE